VSGAVEFRVGTASWTDPTLVNSDLFYPPSVRSAEERLRFYPEQFKTVEVDSTYYALPADRNAKLWTERTPDGFALVAGAYALFVEAASVVQAQTRVIAGSPTVGSETPHVATAERIVLHGVRFRARSDKIDKCSVPVLDYAVQIIRQNPESSLGFSLSALGHHIRWFPHPQWDRSAQCRADDDPAD
jgi:Protein of unknown function DUF72